MYMLLITQAYTYPYELLNYYAFQELVFKLALPIKHDWTLPFIQYYFIRPSWIKPTTLKMTCRPNQECSLIQQ